jgi:hypothetical protein
VLRRAPPITVDLAEANLAWRLPRLLYYPRAEFWRDFTLLSLRGSTSEAGDFPRF